jgi:mannose-6-phosphate isomerase-like protein (cupin superfamily)
MAEQTVFQLGAFAAFAAPDGSITPEAMDDDFWTKRVLEFGEGQLISRMTTAASWDSWEMHPNGDELIFQLSGEMELVIEGITTPIQLKTGSFAVVPKGHWHTANVIEAGDAIYVTNGLGTQHKSR